jgi:hypothetical protein
MIERPFNQIRDALKEINIKNKELVRYVFEKSDNISLWIIGLAIGGLSIIANDLGKVKSGIPPHYLSPILYLLAGSVTTGVIYRTLYLRFYVCLSQINDGIVIAFTRQETMDTESLLKGNESYEGVLLSIKLGFGEDLSPMIPIYNNSDEQGKKILYDTAVNHYNASVEYARRDAELAIEFVADTYSKFIGVNKEKFLKKLKNGNSAKEFKIFKILTIIFYLAYNLMFIATLFLFAASAGATK